MKKLLLTSLVVCAMAFASNAQSLQIISKSVNGSVDDLSYIEGVTGKVSFDATTQTLTLEDATISTTKNCPGVYCSYSDFKIVLKGNNTITCGDESLYFTGEKMTISGDGVLNLECGGYAGLYTSRGSSEQNTIIKDCTVIMKSTIYGLVGYSNGSNTETAILTVDNAKVIAYGKEASNSPAVKNIKQLNLNNCSITYPVGAYFGSSEKTILNTDGAAVCDKVEISPSGEGAVATIESADAPVVIYNVNGVKMGNNPDRLAPGIYIVRQGTSVKKIAIK